MYKLDLDKAEEPEVKLLTSTGSYRKLQNFRKTSTSASQTTRKPQTVWITTNSGKFLKREGSTRPPYLSPEKVYIWVRKQQLELDMEQQTGSKQEKEYIKAVYCHPAYLTYMQSTSCEMPGWINHKLESRLLGEIYKPQICR